MNTFNKFWDCTYVINLESRPDRWESISKFALDAGLHIIKWNAFKAADVNLEKHRIGIRVKKQSCVACSLSHIGIYRDAISKGYQRILVLEDDAQIPVDLYSQVDKLFKDNKIKDFDILYLGGADKYPSAQITDTLAISQYTLLTHAMLFTLDGLKKVIDITDKQDEGKCRMSIDVFLAENIQSQNKTYQAVPSIIKTIASHSDIAGWKRTWDSVLKDCRNQGLKNPKKWSFFVERAKELKK